LKNDNNKKEIKGDYDIKKIIAVLAAAIILMIILLLLNNINYDVDMFGRRQTEPAKKIVFSIPDYESDIYENSEYMAKNRFILYKEDPYTTVITETINEYGSLGMFFLDYFKVLRDGDAEAYNGFFTDDYFEDKNNTRYTEFTMQKIYDAEVEKLTESLIESGEYDGWTRYTYKISYKIMANDGTFRSDMPSDTLVPQIMELLSIDNYIKINSIIKPGIPSV
jgi:hypothetical protein